MTTGRAGTYEVYEGAEGLARLQDEWARLETTGADHFFQTYSYLRLWYDTVGVPTAAKPLLVALREGDRVVGIFPGCRVRQGAVPLLTWLGGPPTLDYGDVLFDAGTAETPVDDFVAESLQLLARHARGAVLYLPNVRDDARAIRLLRSRLRVFKEAAAPFVPITGTWEEYLPSRSRQMRQNINRARRRLSEKGEAEYRILEPGDPDIVPALERLVGFKRARYDAPGVRTNLFDEHYVRFRTEQATREPYSRVATLQLDGTCIAVQLLAVFRNRCYCILSGFDGEYAPASPGFLLDEFILRTCFQNGWDPCDFCWGNEADKYRWTDRDIPLTTFVGSGVTGTILSAAAGTGRRLAEMIGDSRKKPQATSRRKD